MYLFKQQALFVRHLLQVSDVVVYFLRVLALLPLCRFQLVLQLPLRLVQLLHLVVDFYRQYNNTLVPTAYVVCGKVMFLTVVCLAVILSVCLFTRTGVHGQVQICPLWNPPRPTWGLTPGPGQGPSPPPYMGPRDMFQLIHYVAYTSISK